MARDVPLINNLIGSIFLVVFFEFVVIKEIENYLVLMVKSFLAIRHNILVQKEL
jgi:hypothetical protein